MYLAHSSIPIPIQKCSVQTLRFLLSAQIRDITCVTELTLHHDEPGSKNNEGTYGYENHIHNPQGYSSTMPQ